MATSVLKSLAAATLLLVVGAISIFADQPSEKKPAVHETLQIQGWTVYVNHQLRQRDPQLMLEVLDLLDMQLQRVVQAVPSTAVRHLQTVKIWINPTYPGIAPRAEYHPNGEWLRNNERDPQMAKAIEITNTQIFAAEDRRMPWLMLHELAHAWHDQVLGFDEPRIRAAYEVAKKSGSYEAVQRFTGLTTVTDKAYALSNHKEYFAETTEAYFGKNDFYPFVKAELQEHDPEMHALLPILWQTSP